MITLKLIKTTEFNVDDKTKATAYVGAYKGHVFNVSSLDFDAADLVVDKTAGTIAIKSEVEMHKNTYVKDFTTGEIAVGFKLKQRNDLPMAVWATA